MKLSILVDTKRASIFRAFLRRLLQGMVEVLPPEEQDRPLLRSLRFWHTGALSYWYPGQLCHRGPELRTPAAGKNAAALGLASFSAQPNATHFACRGWWNFWTIESIIKPGGVKGMKMQKNKIAQNLMVLRQLHQLSQEEVAGRIGVSLR